MLSKISGIKCGEKLFDLRIIRIVKMKVEITGDQKLMRNSSSKGEESMKITEKVRKGYRFASFGGSWRRTIDIEDSKTGT